jgi:hypothetical protein
MRHLQLQKYLNLPQKGSVIAEYVWIDGSNGLRSKSKVSTFQFMPQTRRYRGSGHLQASWGETAQSSFLGSSVPAVSITGTTTPTYAGAGYAAARPL